jgi:hypothetical protein
VPHRHEAVAEVRAEESGSAGDEDALDHGGAILRESVVAESPADEDDAPMPTRDAHPEPLVRFVAGTMTGTSIDGELDAALVEIRGSGIGMAARFVAGRSHPLGALADDLRRVARQEPIAAAELARIARSFGEAHAQAVVVR